MVFGWRDEKNDYYNNETLIKVKKEGRFDNISVKIAYFAI